MVNEISNMLIGEPLGETIDRGKQLEVLLTNVCTNLGEAGTLTEGKADLEFLLGIVASYIKAKKEDKLEEGTVTPGTLFEDRVFPQLDAFEEKVEEIEDGDEELSGLVGETTPTPDTDTTT